MTQSRGSSHLLLDCLATERKRNGFFANSRHLIRRLNIMIAALQRWTLVLGCLSCSFTQAQDVVRIEEDWELQVSHPDSQVEAPQVVTTMLPFGADSDILFQIDVNHGSSPEYSVGGLQVRICDDTFMLGERRLKEGLVLDQSEETVSWTTVVNKTAYGFNFGLVNGSSSSWGSFGGSGSFTWISYASAEAFNLANYSHLDSLANSGVTFARNRVVRLRLKNVRVFYGNGTSSNVSVNEDIEEGTELE